AGARCFGALSGGVRVVPVPGGSGPTMECGACAPAAAASARASAGPPSTIHPEAGVRRIISTSSKATVARAGVIVGAQDAPAKGLLRRIPPAGEMTSHTVRLDWLRNGSNVETPGRRA